MKVFDAALRRAIAQGGAEQVRQAAESLLISAASGVPWALQMLAERLDGKAPQSVEVTRKRDVEELGLEELRERVATMLGVTGQAPGSATEPPGVH
jgi:hypothetical protein